ncbi:putative phage tail region protein [Actibacterium atlanticum]|uniref:Putative phage tail region protein n=1 Tax=Actibacterium atlanticum TaxID=1461693 RepID=A0A058ZQ54_9RHOB|nr:baseplate J/gp47 family protein [Actibacterium atlanticum]KCV83683.1 putative phage tail region protein [Actibacterium atlanticum]
MTELTESFLEERRERLRGLKHAKAKVNGIDYVSVDMAARQLDVHFLRPVPGRNNGRPEGSPPLTADNFRITGGDRIRNVTVVAASNPSAYVMRLQVDQLGDFSPYVLEIVEDAMPWDRLPGMDPILWRIGFGFRQGCPSDFDCKTAPADGATPVADPPLNYLAKDYASFRQLMLDRLAQFSPDFADRQVPDLGVTMVELMAYLGDHLSHAQDAAATEAYLSTARRRSSVRRHAQLLGYDVHDGMSARGFVQLIMGAGQSGSFTHDQLKFLTADPETDLPALTPSDISYDASLKAAVQFFEPVPVLERQSDGSFTERPTHAAEALNNVNLYDWGDPRAVLRKGARSAWISAPAGPHNLSAGDLICFVQLRDPVTHRRADAELAHRQVVRLTQTPVPETDTLAGQDLLRLEWGEADALRFDLAVGWLDPALLPDGGAPQMAQGLGNVLLVDHGLSLPVPEQLPAPMVDDDPDRADQISRLSELDRPTPYKPVLARRDISVVAPVVVDPGALAPAASDLLRPQAGQGASKAITLSATANSAPEWQGVNSLIFSAPHDKVFVAETEQDGTTTLRFGGPDLGGLHPPAGDPLFAHTRLGVGQEGNIGADAIAHVILDGVTGVVGARNPLPFCGGRDRETIPEIREAALSALDDNRRAVTRADYVRLAQEHPQVARAHVRSLWHGSWESYFIAIDPVGGIEADDALLADVRAHLEPYRLMGHDIEVERPRFAPLEIEISICVDPAYLPSDVRMAVLERLSSAVQADGTLGFFHPDNLSFGAPIYTSHITAAVLGVDGVVDMRFELFRRWRGSGSLALENGVIAVDPEEIPLLMNDPSFPERGVLRVREWSMA